jgi:hypothetical protein
VAKALVAGVEYPLLNPESLAVDTDDIEARLTPALALTFLSTSRVVFEGKGRLSMLLSSFPLFAAEARELRVRRPDMVGPALRVRPLGPWTGSLLRDRLVAIDHDISSSLRDIKVIVDGKCTYMKPLN